MNSALPCAYLLSAEPMRVYFYWCKYYYRSLGCVLFGLMHGSSPFEMEFLRTNNDNYYAYYHTNHRQPPQQQEMLQEQQYGLVRIIECTHLKILGEVPFPPWSKMSPENEVGCGTNGKYPLALYRFVRYMVHHDRLSRPHVHDVAERFSTVYMELLEERWIPHNSLNKQHEWGDNISDAVKGDGVANLNHDEFDSFIASRRG